MKAANHEEVFGSIVENQRLKKEAEHRAELERQMDLPSSPSKGQVDGTHYKDMVMQPHEFIHMNGIGFHEGSVIKYVSRWKNKNGLVDLRKAIHFLELLIELEEKNT